MYGDVPLDLEEPNFMVAKSVSLKAIAPIHTNIGLYFLPQVNKPCLKAC